jgi:hypothetical protein
VPGALASFDGPPEPVLQQYRTRTDRQAAGDERDNLLAVAPGVDATAA